MRTIGNNIPLNGSEYDSEENTATYYEDGFSVATLNFNTDEFEDLKEMTTEDEEFYYSEMSKSKNEYEYNGSMVLTESDYR